MPNRHDERRFSLLLKHTQMPGTLYLLPNLVSEGEAAEFLPEGTLAAMRRIDYFLVEAAKTARASIKAMGHPKPAASLRIEEIGHDPDPSEIDRWLAPVLEGQDAAILSESGCPGVADPGAQIVARAHALSIGVRPLVGPSSILLALMASGLDGQRFRFLGYLPIHADERRKFIEQIERQSSASETQLFIETPYRNTQMLAALLETLKPSTRVSVATDLTGQHECIRTLTVDAGRALTEAQRELPKLPTIFALLAAPSVGDAPRYAPQQAKRKGSHTDIRKAKQVWKSGAEKSLKSKFSQSSARHGATTSGRSHAGDRSQKRSFKSKASGK